MVIDDIEYVEEVDQSLELETWGSSGSISPLSSLFNLISTIYPASSASIVNLGNSGNNTAISINFAMPIMFVFNGYEGMGNSAGSAGSCRPFRGRWFRGV